MDSIEVIQSEFVKDMQEVSPLIEDYMAAELYQLELDYAESDPGDDVIFNLLLTMVIGELTTMGIDVLGGTDIYNDPIKIELIKVLRSEFDIRNLKRLLARSEDFRNAIDSASGDWDEENIVKVVADIAKEIFPVGTRWEYIANLALENIVSTHSLERHILRLIEHIENGTYTDSEEDDLVIKYTSAISEQRSRYIRNVGMIRRDIIDIEGIVQYKADILLDKSLISYDIDLINNMHPDYILVYLDPKDPHPAYRADGQPDIELVGHHKRLHSHHAECLGYKNLITGELSNDAPYVLMLVADGYREPWSEEKNIAYFLEYVKDLNLSSEIITLAKRWFSMITR